MPRFDHDGISHYYTVAGEGFPLVFVHGLGLSHQNWIGQVPIFARHYQVITYDMRGHGGTGVSDRPVTIRDYSEDLHALLRHLNIERAALVGYSCGTLICENFALDHPEMVAGLCLAASYARVKGVFLRMLYELSKLAIQSGLRKIVAYAVATMNAENLTQRGFFFRIAKRVHPEEAMRLMHASEQFYTARQVAQIKCPILLVHGSQDRFTELYAREFVQRMPHARIAVIEHCGHAVPTRAIRPFNLLLDQWLKTLHLSPFETPVPTR